MSAGDDDSSDRTVRPADPGHEVAAFLKAEASRLGLSALGITDTDLAEDEARLLEWLHAGMHGEMAWMARHGTLRSRPAELFEGTIRVISVRLDYFPAAAADASEILADPLLAYVSRYALGRDYHKVLRQKLKQLATRTAARYGEFRWRALTDSAPVLEKPLARKAGLGWIGKHGNLLSEDAGSWYFLGELYTDLPLPVDPPATLSHCGSCSACRSACPTGAIVADQVVDARRCISYLTIELRDAIPIEFRAAIGNRIYGCDDCQLVCPFNKFSSPSTLDDFAPRHALDRTTLVDLFSWSEAEFLHRMAGSAIRRIGYECWLRNIAVALGNGPADPRSVAALESRRDHPSALVREHVSWALERLSGEAHQSGGSAT